MGCRRDILPVSDWGVRELGVSIVDLRWSTDLGESSSIISLLNSFRRQPQHVRLHTVLEVGVARAAS
jgi:hypothetical protein